MHLLRVEVRLLILILKHPFGMFSNSLKAIPGGEQGILNIQGDAHTAKCPEVI